MAQLDNSQNENEEFELMRQLRLGPKIAVNQDELDIVYALMLEDAGGDSSFNSVAQAASAGYSDECGQLEAKVVTHILTVKERIGKGGFGVVYKAESRSSKGKEADPRLCLKLGFHKTHYACDEQRDSVQVEINSSIFREAQNFKLLSAASPHENIIGFRFCCVSDDNEYIIGLEYFEGKNLSTILRELEGASLPSKNLHDIMRQSAAAVKHLWSLGIVHCDIKPRNVLYNCFTKKLKFVDFGSAVLLEEVQQHQETETENCCAAGTPEYMAFEMLRDGIDGVQEKSDIYSLGMLFYRLVALEVPWHFIEEITAARREHNSRDVKHLILEHCESSEGPSLIQERLKSKDLGVCLNNSSECDIIHNMLHLNPSDRPSCEDLVKRLDSLDRLLRLSSSSSLNANATDSRPTSVAQFDSTNTAESTLPTTMKESHAALVEDVGERRDGPTLACPEGEYDGEDEAMDTEDS